MFASVDFIGISALIAAFTGLVSAVGVVIVNVRATQVNKQVDEVHAAVSTPPDTATLGVLAANTNKTINGGPHDRRADDTPDATPAL